MRVLVTKRPRLGVERGGRILRRIDAPGCTRNALPNMATITLSALSSRWGPGGASGASVVGAAIGLPCAASPSPLPGALQLTPLRLAWGFMALCLVLRPPGPFTEPVLSSELSGGWAASGDPSGVVEPSIEGKLLYSRAVRPRVVERLKTYG